MKPIYSQILFVIIFSASYLLIFYYPILTLGKLLNIYYNMTFQTIALILLIMPLLIRILTEKFNLSILRTLRDLTMFYLGFNFILLISILTFKLLTNIFSLDLKYLGIIILTLTITISTIGFMNAQMLNIKTIKLTSNKIKHKYKIVQLTDIHIGSRSTKFLEKIVNKTNTLNPDYVVITGDLVDFNTIGYEDLYSLKKLKTKTYFVIGNHERYVDTNKIISILQKLNIIVLRNETLIDKEIQFIGIDDADSKLQVSKVLKNIKLAKEKYSILLYHRPKGFNFATEKGINLMLCGHTHKGQIFPFNFLVKLQFKEIVGLHHKKNSFLYVSPGTGTWGPILRLGSRNEITLFEISK